jgi:fructuronate reductase
LKCGEPITRLALGVAAWFVFLRGRADDGATFSINDPLAPRLTSLAENAGSAPENLVGALLGCRDVFDPELASNEAFRLALIEAVTQLSGGARAAIERTAKLG